MAAPHPSDIRKRGRETVIEDAVMARPDLLGYPSALAIRNWRVAPRSGRVDLGLLPAEGPVKLVLVEAKAATAQDAASKVVGQLMMYYAGALMLGSDGLDALRRFAVDHAADARSTSKISHVKLSGGYRPSSRAFALLSGGTRLVPADLRMFLALDGEPHHALEPVLQLLYEHHQLAIGLVVVRDGAIVRVAQPNAG